MGKRLRFSTLVVLAMAVAGGVGSGGCNVTDPPPFKPLGYQKGERDLAADVWKQHHPPQYPTTMESPYTPYTEVRTPAGTQPATGPYLGDAPVVRLSLQDLIQRSVANAHEVKVAGYEPAIEQTRIIEAQARFDPAFFVNTQYDRRLSYLGGTQFTLPNDPFVTPAPIFFSDKTRTYQFAAGFRQQLESGGQAEIRSETTLTDVEPQRTIQNPIYTNELVLEVTQPLLRDFGAEINRARITIARNTHKISVLEYRNKLEENIQAIEAAYWELVRAQRDVDAITELVDRTESTADILSKRFGQDATRETISQAVSQLELRRAQLVTAKARVGDLSDELKRRVNDPNLPVSTGPLILPATPPTLDPITFDLTDQMKTAMDFRPELSQQQLRIDNAAVVLKVAKNNLLPQLNFITRLGLLGGASSIEQAVHEQGESPLINYRFGLQLEIPIGNRANRAIYQRSALQRQQAIEEYMNQVAKVSQDVKAGLRDVLSSWETIVSTRKSVYAAADALASIQARQDANQPLDPEFVQLKLNRQLDLAQSQQAYNQAVSNYNTAIVRLERAKGTLLRYNNILLQEERLPFGMQVAAK